MPDDVPDPFRAIPGTVPLVLLPVRLETRVEEVAGGRTDLLVRIYPDTLHVDAHDPRLTAREIARGQRFWVDTWRAASDEAAQRRAWRALAGAFGAARAAWISRALEPLNPGDRPEQPVNPAQDLPVPPEWPEPEQRADGEVRPAFTQVLPSRWLLQGSAGEQQLFRHWCSEVPSPLRLSPDPTAEGLPDRPAVDEGFAWMVDFDAALAVGMAARVRLPADDLEALDTLLAVGIKAPAPPGDAPDLLAGLLEAHHFTDGLELLPPGVPTNNTGDAGPAHRAVDPDHDRSFATERGSPLATDGDGSDGARVAAALGLDTETLAYVAGADDRGDVEGSAMNTVLWPATWGYYLDQMLRTVNEEQAAGARRFFIDHVRGRGPYPTLRVGRQPYGLLPVTSLAGWLPSGESDRDDLTLVFQLRRARELWRQSVEQVAHVPSSERPDLALLEVLSTQPVSVRYAARPLLGPSYLRHLGDFVGRPPPEQWWQRLEELADPPLDVDAVPWLRDAVWGPRARQLDLPLIAEDEDDVTPSATDPLEPNVLRWVREHGYRQVRDRDPDLLPTLLGKLARHTTLLAYATAAQQLRASRGLPSARFEHELVGIHPGAATRTAWTDLAEVLPEVSGSVSLGEWLDSVEDADAIGEPSVTALAELRRALELLADVPPARLARLLPETIDCASHRLDAWATAVASKRLDTVRVATPGVALGGYGWLSGSGLGRAGRDEGAGGFIHAPSLAHAATAAVLRGGRDSHSDVADALSIDLSSRRARLARWLLDGVAHGQPLGALLGYRVERGLHEGHPGLELDRFIEPLRRLAPLGGQPGEGGDGDGDPQETVTARDVVDGLALHRQRERTGLPYGTGGLPETGTPEHAAVEAELDALDGLVDALGDATLAEAVHQLVQGNTARVHATLAALAHGDVPPPDLEVLRTPRTGTGLSHRVIVLLQDEVTIVEGWPDTSSPRAAAEPRLDAWAAGLLGDPRLIRARTGIADADPATPLRQISLADLGLSPLDVLYAGADDRDPLGELATRIAHAARLEDGAPDTDVVVHTDRDPDWPPGVLSFDELAEIVRTAHEVVTAGEALERRDLAPRTGAAAAVDAEPTAHDLAARAEGAVATLQVTTERLERALEAASVDDTSGGIAELPAAVLAAAAFGSREACPSPRA